FATPPIETPTYTFDLGDEYPRARFATSSERSSLDTPPHTSTTATATPRYDPLGVLAQVSIAEQNRERIAALNIPRSAPHEVASGVMSDGRWNVRHPAVQTCLTTRPPRPSLKNRAASSIYTLAALSVRLTPFHEHYNDFWNAEIRNDTAEFIDSVMRTEPRLIDTYPCTWLGSQEMLWQSRNFNAAQEKARNEELGITSSPNNRKMSLRKRKAAKPAAPRVQTDEVVEGLPEPPRKRARKTKPTPKAAAAMAAAAAAAAAANTGGANEDASPAKPTTGATLAPPTKTSPKAPSPLGVFSPIIASASLPEEDSPAAPASRGRTSNKGSKRGSAAPTAPTRPSARPTTHDRSPSTSESSTATSSMAADLKRGRSSSSASSTPATPPEAAQAVDVKSKGETNDIPDLAEAIGDSAEPQTDSAHATRARTRAAAKRATVESEAPAPDAEAMQVDEPEVPKTKSQSRKRAATDDAAADEKAVSAPAPKKRKRTSGVTRARTTRRR
ncbi:hypothetical protein EVG20_g10497, partial [Dentipellis fragilis]